MALIRTVEPQNLLTLRSGIIEALPHVFTAGEEY